MKRALKNSLVGCLCIFSVIGSFELGYLYREKVGYDNFIKKIKLSENYFLSKPKIIYVKKGEVNNNLDGLEFVVKELNEKEQTALIEDSDGNNYLIGFRGSKGFVEEIEKN